MKYLKLFESFEDVDSICMKYGIKNYTINDDGSIDVDDHVNLSCYSLIISDIPLEFRNVSGSFWCNGNELITLDGCPQSVGGDFNCGDNDITKLEGGPKSVGVDFYCRDNHIISFEGCPESVGGDFNCSSNRLTSLEGCSKYIGGDFNCNGNEIRTFEGFPTNLVGSFYCGSNPVFQLWKLFWDKEKVELFNDFGITDGEVVILDRLNEFLEMIGVSVVIDTSGLEKEGYKII